LLLKSDGLRKPIEGGIRYGSNVMGNRKLRENRNLNKAMKARNGESKGDGFKCGETRRLGGGGMGRRIRFKIWKHA